MNEQFLSYLWRYRLYKKELITTAGIPVTVIKPGEQHSNAGPDFFNARIRIGDTLWAGNIEIHIRSSDWYRHGHQTDHAYDNVVLHVVYECDSDIITEDMTTIPTIELKHFIDDSLLLRFAELKSSTHKIPCADSISHADTFTVKNWIDRMLSERLEQKAEQIDLALQTNRGDWEDAFYQLLARNFGFKINAGPFEMLARTLPRTLLLRHAAQPLQQEALVFGQAGFLEGEFVDNYPRLLQQEYRFLQRKFGLVPLEKHLWKFLRMRPVNFPTVRLSQFNALVGSGLFSFSELLRMKNPMDELLKAQIAASDYWYDHYLFDRPSTGTRKLMGRTSIYNLLINTIVPALFYYGRMKGDEESCQRAFEMLRSIPVESNHILEEWERVGIKASNAFEGQALTGLYSNYCSHKRCLSCAIGKQVMTAFEVQSQ